MKKIQVSYNDLFERNEEKTILKVDLIVGGQPCKKGDVVQEKVLPENPENYLYLVANTKEGRKLVGRIDRT